MKIVHRISDSIFNNVISKLIWQPSRNLTYLTLLMIFLRIKYLLNIYLWKQRYLRNYFSPERIRRSQFLDNNLGYLRYYSKYKKSRTIDWISTLFVRFKTVPLLTIFIPGFRNSCTNMQNINFRIYFYYICIILHSQDVMR